MRFVRTIAGIVLLTVGLLALVAGGSLWTVMDHRDAGGAFTGVLERVETPGYAMVVPEVGELLRRDAPLVQSTRARLRVTASMPGGRVFVGIAPAIAVNHYLAGQPHATVDSVAVSRGQLPVRLTEVEAVAPRPTAPSETAPSGAAPSDTAPFGAAPSDAAPSDTAPRTGEAVARLASGPDEPGTQIFWTRHGEGWLDLEPADLAGRGLSMVIMRSDARQGVNLDLRVEARVGWLDPAAWGSLAGGAVLLALGMVILIRPRRPREVVFVVEPQQVPRLAARLGLTGLSDIGRPVPRTPWRFAPAVPAPAQPAGRAPIPEQAGEPGSTPVPASTGEPASTPMSASTGEPWSTAVPASTGEPSSTWLPAPVTGAWGGQLADPVQPDAPAEDPVCAVSVDDLVLTPAAGAERSAATGPEVEKPAADRSESSMRSEPFARPVHLVRDTDAEELRPARPVRLVSGQSRDDHPVGRPLTLADAGGRGSGPRVNSPDQAAREAWTGLASVPPPAELSLAWPPSGGREGSVSGEAAESPSGLRSVVASDGPVSAPGDLGLVASGPQSLVVDDPVWTPGDLGLVASGPRSMVVDDWVSAAGDSAGFASAPPVPAPPPTRPVPIKPVSPVPAPPPGRPARPVPAPPPNRPVPAGPAPTGSEPQPHHPAATRPAPHPDSDLGVTRPIAALGGNQWTEGPNRIAGDAEPASDTPPEWELGDSGRRDWAQRTDQTSGAC